MIYELRTYTVKQGTAAEVVKSSEHGQITRFARTTTASSRAIG